MMPPAPTHDHDHNRTHDHARPPQARSGWRLSVLAWPAWRRVLAVLPLVLALWLAVWWADLGVPAW